MGDPVVTVARFETIFNRTAIYVDGAKVLDAVDNEISEDIAGVLTVILRTLGVVQDVEERFLGFPEDGGVTFPDRITV
jgi:hypothetical protein